ncbi:hypothetical protein [Streptomyces nanshensis]|uniref:Uncharacterized protein n=1 Tax=Streptomyces nanshensis TaxID=518642 RepID=A0A1E7L5R0_9ACTN|nr:hypothetical protein [Streptomyces nanshensis]OEV11514.1 hypothetical protein AN218_12480 [Streptomyces nanshensis]
MAVIDAEFCPVIVTERPLVDSIGMPYQQLPDGTDPGALRIVRARDVQPGDWYLGDCEQPTPAGEGLFWGGHPYAVYAASPKLSDTGDSLAMDGESFNWDPDELAMILPRHALPA